MFDLKGHEITADKASAANPVILEDDVSNWTFKRYDASGKLQESIEEKGTVRVPVDWTLEGALSYFAARGAEKPDLALLACAVKAERINRQSAARQKRADELGITVAKVFDADKSIKTMAKSILAAYAARGAALTVEEAGILAKAAMGL
jgi:hypothetical protein